MTDRTDSSTGDDPVVRGGNAFLLSQIGSLAARRYAERISGLELVPAQTGLMWTMSVVPGLSQQALAARIGAAPSRLVELIDELQRRNLVERRRGADRRTYELHLTDEGRSMLDRVRTAAMDHDREFLHVLDDDDRQNLHRLLSRIADSQGLTPGVHPGFGQLRRQRRAGGANDSEAGSGA